MNGIVKRIFDPRPEPILQAEAAECGLACLAMVAAYHGYKTDLSLLRRRFPISLKGVNLENLMAIADQLGLSARPIRAELSALNTLQTPAILHWNLNHFVVLTQAGHKHITIHDPARGELKLSYREASNQFSGVAIELRPSPTFTKKEDINPVRLSDFWSRISGLKRSMAQVLLLSVFLQFFALTAPLYQQMVVDDAITKQDSDFLAVLAIGFSLMGLMKIAVSYLRSHVMLYFSSMLNFQMRINLFRHLLRLPIEFFEKRHIGDISSRFGSLSPIGQLFTSGIIAVVLDGVMAISTLALAFLYSVKLTLIVLAFLSFGFLVQWITFPIIKKKNEEILHLDAKLNSNFLETIRAARTIKIFGQETARESIWQNYSANSLNANIWLAKFDLNLGLFGGVVGLGQSVLTLYIGAQLVINGTLTIGMLFAYQAYAGQFSSRMNSLISQVMLFRMLKLHLTRLADIVHEEPEIKPVSESVIATTTKPLRGDITLKNIHYRYGEQEAFVLKGINLDIKAGEMVAIVGASGSGKTTLLKVLLGLLGPQEGEVLIDGNTVTELGLQAYRSNIGVVMQDDQLLSGSIADNISFFDPNIDMQRVVACAQLADFDKDIMKSPMAYNSLVGDMGTTLSGGQRQRLMLARALYRNPRILFLDEGTANLDAESELRISKVISGLPITRVVIAHRPAMIECSDRVIELRDGTVVEK